MVDLEGFEANGRPVGWRFLSIEDVPTLLARFRHWEGMSWSELLVRSKKQNHSIDVDACSRAAKQRLEELQLDDIDQLVSLRVAGKSRVFGILDRNVFQILWWDPQHQVCPSHLKHT